MLATQDRSFDDVVADIAEEIQKNLIKDLFDRSYCIRYNKTIGAYISYADYNDDVILMHNSEFKRDFDYNNQVKHLKETLRSKPFYPVA